MKRGDTTLMVLHFIQGSCDLPDPEPYSVISRTGCCTFSYISAWVWVSWWDIMTSFPVSFVTVMPQARLWKGQSEMWWNQPLPCCVRGRLQHRKERTKHCRPVCLILLKTFKMLKAPLKTVLYNIGECCVDRQCHEREGKENNLVFKSTLKEISRAVVTVWPCPQEVEWGEWGLVSTWLVLPVSLCMDCTYVLTIVEKLNLVLFKNIFSFCSTDEIITKMQFNII